MPAGAEMPLPQLPHHQLGDAVAPGGVRLKAEKGHTFLRFVLRLLTELSGDDPGTGLPLNAVEIVRRRRLTVKGAAVDDLFRGGAHGISFPG